MKHNTNDKYLLFILFICFMTILGFILIITVKTDKSSKQKDKTKSVIVDKEVDYTNKNLITTMLNNIPSELENISIELTCDSNFKDNSFVEELQYDNIVEYSNRIEEDNQQNMVYRTEDSLYMWDSYNDIWIHIFNTDGLLKLLSKSNDFLNIFRPFVMDSAYEFENPYVISYILDEKIFNDLVYYLNGDYINTEELCNYYMYLYFDDSSNNITRIELGANAIDDDTKYIKYSILVNYYNSDTVITIPDKVKENSERVFVD